ncbi:phage tail spike protein [Clostridium perfringens]|uniref:phage tail spike protein n=1 Tax=Clostridium perfringens TaxID=1502 RepID=UPI002409B620|nr:phage tail spike protein [Clostridium perfringens]WFB45931.1 phage tail spike protein [Clostridium perfringens]WFD77500.1 phage tail spike protein [Clostridium perfringens]WFD86056.1 phage tail spike protein [Clostridium perfringens]WFD98868.1 phage tail spike protein [Clostridium perfringens]
MATKDFKIYVNCPLPTKKTTKDFKIIVGELNKASVESIVKIAVKSELRKDVYVKVKDPAKKTYTIVYNPNEKTFISNGLAILDNELIRCEVQEVLNGLYNLELEYPINNKNVDYLIEGNIIKTNTPSGEQPFRIYRTIKNLDTVIVYANHIFFDLQSNFLMDCRYKFATGQQALEDILKSTLYENNFTCDSNIIERNNAYYIRKNPVEAILTEENSIINLYKGELLRDKFKIIINDSIGKDNNVIIEYRKNLLGLEKDEDISQVVTRVIPTGLTAKDSIIMLDEVYVDSSLINNYINPVVKEIHYSDLKEDAEKGITIESIKDQLKVRALDLFNKEHIDLPKVNYKINFLDLSLTEEYKDFKALEKVKLADVVTVRHKDLKIDVKRKVIKYKWDSLTKSYIEIELGDLESTLSNDIGNINSKINTIEKNNKNVVEMANSAIDKVNNLEEVNFRDLKQTMDAIEKVATGNKAQIEFNNKDIAELKDSMKTNTDNIATNLNNINANSKSINEIKEALKNDTSSTEIANINTLIEKMENRLKVLEDALANKSTSNTDDTKKG